MYLKKMFNPLQYYAKKKQRIHNIKQQQQQQNKSKYVKPI